MASFNIDPTISLGIKPPPTMTLGDMVNIARGAQEYKQAQQINPLLLERQQADTELAQRTLEPKIQQQQSQTELASTQSKSSKFKFTNEMAQTVQDEATALSLDPRIINAKNDEAGRQGAVTAILAAKKRAIARGVDEHMAEVITAPYMTAATTDPSTILTELKNAARSGTSAQGITNANIPQLATVNNQPYFVNPAAQTIQPAGQAGQPTASVQATPALALPDMNKPAYSQPTQLLYPIRKAGAVYNALPQEEEDRKVGSSYRSGLVDRQTNLTTSRRNIEEVIKTAQDLEKSILPTSGVAGAIRRNIATAIGDPTYVQLSKDLANTQIANIHAMGGSLDTVAGQQLTKMASGDATYPPEVLIKIARRTEADMTNIDMQATAAQKFANKFGDNNIKSFQQMWAKNADSKIFEGMNIANSDMSIEQKKKSFNDLFGHMSAKEKKLYQEKKNNLQRLMDTGSL